MSWSWNHFFDFCRMWRFFVLFVFVVGGDPPVIWELAASPCGASPSSGPNTTCGNGSFVSFGLVPAVASAPSIPELACPFLLGAASLRSLLCLAFSRSNLWDLVGITKSVSLPSSVVVSGTSIVNSCATSYRLRSRGAPNDGAESSRLMYAKSCESSWGFDSFGIDSRMFQRSALMRSIVARCLGAH
jgi:hypothetical protein